MITFRDIWGNPDFTSERFFNQTDLAGDELWLHKVNATVRKKSYEYCSFSCIVLAIYEQLFLFFLFSYQS